MVESLCSVYCSACFHYFFGHKFWLQSYLDTNSYLNLQLLSTGKEMTDAYTISVFWQNVWAIYKCMLNFISSVSFLNMKGKYRMVLVLITSLNAKFTAWSADSQFHERIDLYYAIWCVFMFFRMTLACEKIHMSCVTTRPVSPWVRMMLKQLKQN